jgi:hypothetical protein
MPTTRTAISATAASSATPQRLVAGLATLNLSSPAAATPQLAAMNVTTDEFAPAFRRVAKDDPAKARTLALAFDDTIKTDEALGQQFEFVARATPEERKVILDAYRTGGSAGCRRRRGAW